MVELELVSSGERWGRGPKHDVHSSLEAQVDSPTWHLSLIHICVITMGIKHMNRVQAALDRELENHPDLEPFFDPNAQERFFVKNLERVQGDERDAIIISCLLYTSRCV